MKVAIVTFEFEGLTKNGGIGTAYRRLADLLVKDGHQVTVVFMPFTTADWKRMPELAALKKRGVRVVFPELDEPNFSVKHDGFHVRRALLVDNFLRGKDFDVVHVSDNCALAYISLLAKAARLDFMKTQFVVGAHGSPLWTAEANGRYTEDSILLAQLDRRSVELADYLVSPSQYMIDFMRKKGWRLPKKSMVIPNVNWLASGTAKKPKRMNPPPNESPGAVSDLKRLVFFGRLERRKGIFLFSTALEIMLLANPEIGTDRPLDVVFLGSDQQWAWGMASDTIRRRLSRFGERTRLTFLTNYSSADSAKYMSENPHSLICMPSLLDNSPYVIVEAIENKADFLAARSGGQAELIEAEDAERILCKPDARSLAQAIFKRLTAKPIEARPSPLALEANEMWRKFHRDIEKRIGRPETKVARVEKPKVTIVLGVRSEDISGGSAVQSISSVLKQDYPNIEICLLDTPGGYQWKIPAKVGRVPVRRIKATEVENAPAIAAEFTNGKYILFLDGGVFAEPNSLRQWVHAAESMESRRSNHIGFSGIVEYRMHPTDPAEFNVPLPMERIRLAIGQCIGNAFTLWHRERFCKLTKKWKLDITHDHSVRPFVSAALTARLEVGSVPRIVIKDQRWPSFRVGDPEDQTLPLEPLLASSEAGAEDFLYCAAALYGEMIHYRDRYFNELNKRQPAVEESGSAQ